MIKNKKSLKNKIVVTGAMVGAALVVPALVDTVESVTGVGFENKALAFEGGTGTAADPYLIGSATELDAIRNNLKAHYKLTKNIDLQGRIWDPIGTSTATANRFSGTLDGGGFTISNMSPSSTVKSQGLFGYVGDATFKNLTIANPNIQVPGSSSTYAGALFGYSDDRLIVENVHVTGAVFGNAYSTTRIGGLGGRMTSFSGSIDNVSVEIDAKTNAGYVGGLIGEATGTTSSGVTKKSRVLNNISVKGEVAVLGKTSSAGSYGGLIGEAANLTLSNIVTDVDVSGYKNVGGILGSAKGAMDQLTLNKVFAYGSVVAPVNPTSTTIGTNVGGIIGIGDAIFRYVYAYNEKVEGNNSKGLVGRLVGKDIIFPDMYGNSFEIIEGNAHSLNVADVITQAEVFRQDQYDRFGFDFNNTWEMIEGKSAPQLKVQDVDSSLYRTPSEIDKYSFAGGSGTVSDPYLVANEDDFRLMTTNTGAHFRLVSDIDLEFAPITPTGTKYDPFTGSFDGNGYTVSNVNIASLEDNVGIFGYAQGAVIRNVKIINADVLTQGSYAGALVGYLQGGSLTNIHLGGKINVTGDDYVGGMVGYYNRKLSKISEYHSKLRLDDVVVKGVDFVGGVYGNAKASGRSSKGKGSPTYVNEVFVNAEVKATGTDVGGFAGESRDIALKDAVILGSVEGKGNVGGIGNAPKGVYSVSYGGSSTSYDYDALTKFENVIAYNHVKGLTSSSTNIGGGFGEFSSGTINGVFLYNSSVDVGKIGAIAKSYAYDGYKDPTKRKNINGLYQYETIPGSAAVGYVDEIVDSKMVKDVEFYRASSTMDFGKEWVVADNGHPALMLNPKQADHDFTEDQEQSSQFAGGTGTVEDPFLIANPTQFERIADNLKSHFKLVADVDFDHSVLTRVIGEKSTLSFEGSLDGNGFALKNVNIQTTDDYQGIFGYVADVATVKNLKIKGATISTAFANTGILAGRFDGNLQNVTIEDVEANVSKGGYFGVVAGRSSGSYDASTLEGNVQNLTIKNAKIVAPDTIDNIGGAFGTVTSKLNAENVFVDADINAGEKLGIFVGTLGGAGTYKDIQTTGKVTGLSYLGGYAGSVSSSSTHTQIIAATDLVGGPKAVDLVGGIVGSSSSSGAKFTGIYSFAKEVQGSKSATVGKVFGKTSTSSSFMPIYVNALSTMLGGHSTHVSNSLTPTQILDKASFSRSGMTFDGTSNWEHEAGFIPYLKESKIKLALGSNGWQQNAINSDAQFVSAAQAFIDQAFNERNATILDSALIEINKIESDQASKTNLINQMNDVKQFVKASNAVKKVWQTFKTAHYNIALQEISEVANSSWRTTLTGELGNVLDTIDEQNRLLGIANTLIDAAIENKTKENVDLAQSAIDILRESEGKTAAQNRLDSVIGAIEVREEVERQLDILELRIASSGARQIYSATLALIKEASIDIDVSVYDQRMIQAYIDLQMVEKHEDLYYDADNAVTKAEKDNTLNNAQDAQDKIDLLPDGNVKDKLQDRLDEVLEKVGIAAALDIAIKKASETMARADYDEAKKLFDKLVLQADITKYTPLMSDLLKLIESAEAVTKAEAERTEDVIKEARAKLNSTPKTFANWTVLDTRLKALEAEFENAGKLEAAEKAVEKAEGSLLQADIDAAQKLVTALPDAPEDTANKKAELQDRLDAIIAQIQAKEEFEKAEAAVEKAEDTMIRTDFDAAQDLVDKLPAGSEKDALQDRLDAILKAIEDEESKLASIEEATKAVEKAEGSKLDVDIDDAQTKVDGLPDSDIKTELQDRLDKLKGEKEDADALAEATKAVEKAEGSKAELDINDAQSKVTALKDSPEKQALQDRLDALKDGATDADKLAEATKAVEKAETTLTDVDFNDAQSKVTALKDSPEKDALQNRLDALKDKIDADKALDEATKAVEKAEGSKTLVDIDDAQTKVTALPDSVEKKALQDRLDALKSDLENASELEKATQAVEKAETTLTQEDVDSAQDLVTKLDDSPEKDALQDRLDALQSDLNALDEAKKAVEGAEKSKSEEDINNAQDKIDALPDGKDKADLQDRLDKVKADLENEKALEDAKDAVDKAESSKDEADIKDAESKLESLPDGKEKDDLQDRLDKVKDEIESNVLFQTLVNEVKAINKGILDDVIKPADFPSTKEELESIRQRGEALTNVDQKTQLGALIDATLALMDLVDKIEGGDKTLETIEQLPDSKIKDKYLGELAESDALAAAEKAVVKAENTIDLADIEAAEDLVVKLAPSDKKEELKERLKDVRDKYEEQQLIKRATALVEQAESTKRITDIERAEDVVKQLKDGDVKTGLQERLDAIRKALDDAALEAATKAVEKAEELKTNASIGYAKDKVNGLRPSPEKDALLDRIAALEKEIFDQEQMDRLYKQALEAVIKAENSSIVAYLNTAIKLVGKVSDADVRKQDLVDRVKAIQLRNQIAAVETELERLELRPTQSGVEKVQGLINKLPDAVAEKEAFQTRLDAVKQKIDNENYAKALKAVEFAESAKIESKRAAYYSALPLVDVLLDSERKTALEKRLAKILSEVEAYEKLDGDYKPGDSVVKAAQSIKDATVKKSLLAWANAVEDAEVYNSTTLLKALTKVQQAVPQEILDNEKYADLIEELTQRTIHVKESSKVFSGITARGVIKKVYVAMLKFEGDRTEANKNAAEALINDLKRFKGHEGQVEKLFERLNRIEIVTE